METFQIRRNLGNPMGATQPLDLGSVLVQACGGHCCRFSLKHVGNARDVSSDSTRALFGMARAWIPASVPNSPISSARVKYPHTFAPRGRARSSRDLANS